MESYRSLKYVERYEDVIFELETPLNTVLANTRSQKRTVIVLLSIIQEK